MRIADSRIAIIGLLHGRAAGSALGKLYAVLYGVKYVWPRAAIDEWF